MILVEFLISLKSLIKYLKIILQFIFIDILSKLWIISLLLNGMQWFKIISTTLVSQWATNCHLLIFIINDLKKCKFSSQNLHPTVLYLHWKINARSRDRGELFLPSAGDDKNSNYRKAKRVAYRYQRISLPLPISFFSVFSSYSQ